MHHPCTAAMVGFWAYQSFMYVSTKRFIIRQSATESQTRRRGASAACRPSADWAGTAQSRPYPAQKAGPSARSRVTCTSGSVSASSMAAASSSRRSGVMVLYSPGRASTIERTPSVVSVRRVFMSARSPGGWVAVNRSDFGYGIPGVSMRLPAACILAVLATRALAVDLGAVPSLAPGLRTLEDDKAALDQADQRLDSRLRGLRGLAVDGRLRAGPRGGPAWRRNGWVHVLVRVERLDDGTRAALTGAGLSVQHEEQASGLVEGWMPAGAVRGLAGLSGVSSVRPVERGHTRVGSVTSAGVAAARADMVQGFGIDGSGVRVGVISDGLDGLAASRASGNLPDVTVPSGCGAGSGAEGTAILEIVHDVAPGASLLFASGIDSTLAFNQAVRCLEDAGANVIVDDLQFFGEPYFEDGPVADAVRAAVQGGVSYHSAAGNSGQLHWDGLFQPSPNTKFHDFNTGGGIDNTNGVLVSPGGSLLCVLQWDDPFGGAADDYDLLLLDGQQHLITASQDV